MSSPVVLDFPLRGEWVTPNTPAKRVPSHGTDALGQRYAFDFVGLDPQSSSMRFYRSSPLHYLMRGVRLQDCFGWGRPIYSAAEGTVVQAQDGWPERNPVHFARDLALMLKHAWTFDLQGTADLRALSGNYIIVETRDGYLVYAHAQTGSIQVAPGDKVASGRLLANVGHSGNSTAPHLHFHLMNHPDPRRAQGIACCFREYEVFTEGEWRRVQNGIPRHTDRIRKI